MLGLELELELELELGSFQRISFIQFISTISGRHPRGNGRVKICVKVVLTSRGSQRWLARPSRVSLPAMRGVRCVMHVVQICVYHVLCMVYGV